MIESLLTGSALTQRDSLKRLIESGREGVDKQTEKPDSTQYWLTVIRFLMNGLVLRIWRNWQTRYFEVVVE